MIWPRPTPWSCYAPHRIRAALPGCSGKPFRADRLPWRPGAYYDKLRARGAGHHAALRQLSNRLVGVLHGCLKTRILYNELIAWGHHLHDQSAAA